MLAIVTAATKGYLHCWPQTIRRIAAAASHHDKAHFILATDTSDDGKAAGELARNELPEGWMVSVIPLALDDSAGERYKEAAQIRIAKLQGAAFALARRMRATACWSVESDNLVPPDALRVLEWTLVMPTEGGRPYYDIAAATYPNGLFLGGFGTPQNPIAEDFTAAERTLSPRLTAALAACRARLTTTPANEREQKRLGRLVDRARKCPPAGNVFEVTGKHGWRRRGWMDAAYPGIGRGAVVPSDWCGLGCTLLSARALALATFEGYEGKGTQDLFLCWQRWHPAALRIACVPHVVCDHIKPDKDGHIVHHRAYHEQEGECRGHLRQRQQPWIPC
jgi:hypothetical protein